MSRTEQKALTLSATDFQVGDRVRTVDREATPDETKKRIFFNHMRNLSGIVRRVYEEESEIWIDVDLNSLPETVRQRHEETEAAMRNKWLDSLSDEARRKLGNAESTFKLKYSVLTSPNHVILEERGAEAPPTGPQGRSEDAAPKRKTLKDLNAAEREFLDRSRTGNQPE